VVDAGLVVVALRVALSLVVVGPGAVLAGVLSELVAGQGVVPVGPVVGVTAAVVDPFSTVESVWVCDRPGSTAGVVLAFVPPLVTSVPCLATDLAAGLCAEVAVAVALAGASLCECLIAL
jgi:hypothetical protein